MLFFLGTSETLANLVLIFIMKQKNATDGTCPAISKYIENNKLLSSMDYNFWTPQKKSIIYGDIL